MSKIVVGTHGDKNVGFDLDLLLATRLLIQANSGGGKSWLLRRLAEQLFGKVPVIIIDPEGEFATLREKYDYVLIGEGGEAPAHVRSARLLAERLLQLRACAVCDLYETFRKTPIERHLWVKEFLGGLLDAPKSLWGETVIIVDEAHMFCPEQGESPAEGVMIGVATAGRKRGFCPIWATQRLALVNKSASSQLQNRMVGLTFEDVDVKRATELLSVAKEDQHDFKAQVKVLEPGDFFAFGRAISTERILLRSGPVETSHPKMGRAARAASPPPTPEKIKAMLPQLADLPKEAEEKTRTEAELRREVAALRRELNQKQPVAPVIDKSAIQRALAQRDHEHERSISVLNLAIAKLKGTLSGIAKQAASAADIELPEAPAPAPYRAPVQSTRIERPDKPASNGNGDSLERLGPGERATLIATAQYNEGVERDQLSILTGYKKSSRDTYIQRLAQKGYIEQRGRCFVATEAGVDYLGSDYELLPHGEALQDYWRKRLPEGERKVLEVLINSHPDPIQRDRIDETTGYKKSSRDTYLQRLGARRLIEVTGKSEVKAADLLFA